MQLRVEETRTAENGDHDVFRRLLTRVAEKLKKSGLRHESLCGLRLSSDGTPIDDDETLRRALSVTESNVISAVAVFSGAVSPAGSPGLLPTQSAEETPPDAASTDRQPEEDMLALIETSSDGVRWEPSAGACDGNMSKKEEPADLPPISEAPFVPCPKCWPGSGKPKGHPGAHATGGKRHGQRKRADPKLEQVVSEEDTTSHPGSSHASEVEPLSTEHELKGKETADLEKPTVLAEWWGEMAASGWTWKSQGGVGFGRYIAPDKTEFADHPDQRPYAAMVRYHLNLPVAEEELNRLMEMGFPREKCHHALQLFAGNIENAAAFLMNGEAGGTAGDALALSSGGPRKRRRTAQFEAGSVNSECKEGTNPVSKAPRKKPKRPAAKVSPGSSSAAQRSPSSDNPKPRYRPRVMWFDEALGAYRYGALVEEADPLVVEDEVAHDNRN